MNCFVYLILVDGVPRYVGKGHGSRPRDHMQVVRRIARRRAAGETIKATRFYNKLTKAWLNGSEITYELVVDGLTDDQAFELERQTIASMRGLWNLHPGGRGMTSDFAKQLWAQSSDAEKRKAQLRQERIRSAELLNAAQNQYWADPARREERSAKFVDLWKQPAFQEKMKQRSATKPMGFGAKVTAANLARWSDPEKRRRQSEIKRVQWADPVFRSRMIEARRKRNMQGTP